MAFEFWIWRPQTGGREQAAGKVAGQRSGRMPPPPEERLDVVPGNVGAPAVGTVWALSAVPILESVGGVQVLTHNVTGIGGSPFLRHW